MATVSGPRIWCGPMFWRVQKAGPALLGFVPDDLYVRAQPRGRGLGVTGVLRGNLPRARDFIRSLARLLGGLHGGGELVVERRVLLEVGYRHDGAVTGDDL